MVSVNGKEKEVNCAGICFGSVNTVKNAQMESELTNNKLKAALDATYSFTRHNQILADIGGISVETNPKDFEAVSSFVPFMYMFANVECIQAYCHLLRSIK